MFDKDFLWGVSTAAYQIEGAYLEDGKSLSVWDTFTNTQGNIYRNQNGNIACDHYHRYKEDVALMKGLGVDVYRFSISWSRILPNGVGEVNQKGIEFYLNLIDELLKNNITPYVTLYHWDLPQCLQDKGGYLNPDFPKWFEEYTRAVCQAFKGKVKNFITINEPENFIYNGLISGNMAPGLHLEKKDALFAIHNTLLAHGRAVKTIREIIPDSNIGFSACGWVPVPKRKDKELEELAYQNYFDLKDDRLGDGVAIWYDPIFLGKYPKRYYEVYKDIMPKISEDDMKLISQKIDFCGINLYSGYYIYKDENGNIATINPTDREQMDTGWYILPEIMYYSPKFLAKRYNVPIIITESGTADYKKPRNDKVHDELRIDCNKMYLEYLEQAYKEGIDIRGYFHWSLMDNFEWEKGFKARFGLVYVEYKQNQKRIAKDSYYAYKKIIEESKR